MTKRLKTRLKTVAVIMTVSAPLWFNYARGYGASWGLLFCGMLIVILSLCVAILCLAKHSIMLVIRVFGKRYTPDCAGLALSILIVLSLIVGPPLFRSQTFRAGALVRLRLGGQQTYAELLNAADQFLEGPDVGAIPDSQYPDVFRKLAVCRADVVAGTYLRLQTRRRPMASGWIILRDKGSLPAHLVHKAVEVRPRVYRF